VKKQRDGAFSAIPLFCFSSPLTANHSVLADVRDCEGQQQARRAKVQAVSDEGQGDEAA
jgi:hypothetical protein